MTKLRHQSAEQDLAQFLGHYGSVTIGARKRRWEWERKWREAFVGDRAELLAPKSRDRLWHFLSFRTASGHEIVPRLEGGVAEIAFSNAVADAYVIIPEVPSTIVFECAGRLPALEDWYGLADNDALPIDVYVLAADLSWTFVMTHEQPMLGPYFVTRA